MGFTTWAGYGSLEHVAAQPPAGARGHSRGRDGDLLLRLHRFFQTQPGNRFHWPQPEDTAAIADQLSKESIPYELRGGGTYVAIQQTSPPKSVQQSLIAMAIGASSASENRSGSGRSARTPLAAWTFPSKPLLPLHGAA